VVPSPLTREQAVRWLQRATFGALPGEVEALQTTGAAAWLTDQLARTPSETNIARLTRTTSFASTIWEGYLAGADQLRKRVSYALSQIFVVSLDGQSDITAAYADILEAHAFGTYRNLIEHITRSPAMGSYLTYSGNRKADPRTGRVPDENYAREIMQLFSIGLVQLNPDGTPRTSNGHQIPTYGQDDIAGLARVFTGWRRRTDVASELARITPMEAYQPWHETGEKRFLGTTIPANTGIEDSLRIALDTISNHANVGPFISRQLIQRLVTSNPSPGYVGRVAAVWANDGAGVRGNLAKVVEAVLVDDEAWRAPTASFGKLREPALRFTVTARALGTQLAVKDPPVTRWPISLLEDPATELGQQPWMSPSVFNFYRPGYVPAGTAVAAAGLVGPEFQIATDSSVIGWLNWISRWIRYRNSSLTFTEFERWKAMSDTPSTLTAELNAVLCAGRLASDAARIVDDTMNGITNRTLDTQRRDRTVAAIVTVLASTEFLIER
jgi:uncharacterized protein (DUF1800 family)